VASLLGIGSKSVEAVHRLPQAMTSGDAQGVAASAAAQSLVVGRRSRLDADVATLPLAFFRPPEREAHGLSGRQTIRAWNVGHPDAEPGIASVDICPCLGPSSPSGTRTRSCGPHVLVDEPTEEISPFDVGHTVGLFDRRKALGYPKL
jgi:hypothetical protein